MLDDAVDERREGGGLEGLPRGLVRDDAGGKVHRHLIPRRDAVHRRRALQDGESDVDGVAVEDAGKALGDDALDAAGLSAYFLSI